MENQKRYAIFISAYRNTKIKTLQTLTRCGYIDHSNIYIIVGIDDPNLEEFKEKYKDHCIIFDKEKDALPYIDTCINKENFTYLSTVFTSTAQMKIAKELGYKYFMQLDDDSNNFMIRYVYKDKLINIKKTEEGVLDNFINKAIDILDSSPKVYGVSFLQAGDLMGGVESLPYVVGKRKFMNTRIYDVEKQLKFIGLLNEDTTYYTQYGKLGYIFLTLDGLVLDQLDSQNKSSGTGLTSLYAKFGTYIKSFFSLIVNPSALKIMVMGGGGKLNENANKRIYNPRIHHFIEWENICPKILDEKWRKV